MGGLSKKIDGILRERRAKKKRLCTARKEHRLREIRLRRRVLDEHLVEPDPYARAPRGERAYGKAPRNWGKNVSLICAIDAEGVKSSMSVEGAVDSKAFESYIEHFLAPKLKREQIVVMDNLSVHKSKRVQRLIEEVGATLLFLPPYSPDFNPIEEAISKLKSILRKVAARTREALLEATGWALDTITPEDIRGFYTDCGYRLPLQSL